jgi:hypothetical protein
LLAAQVTARFGRGRVLAWYLNSASYGWLAYGADAAARVYFGKPAMELNLAESALLAALAQSPDLDPSADPEITRQRAGQVLQAMQTAGQITPAELDEALSQELALAPPVQPPASVAPAFLTLALDQLQGEYLDQLCPWWTAGDHHPGLRSADPGELHGGCPPAAWRSERTPQAPCPARTAPPCPLHKTCQPPD